MSTQQDIYVASFKTLTPMLNKENYVPWSSHLLRYAKSRPNRKLIYNSIMNGPYVRRMILEPRNPTREVPTILLGLPEDIYAAVDSCETAQEIWLRVQQMMKGFDIGIQDKKVKLFNEWERFTSTDGESIESYYHRFSKLMNDFKRNKHFLEKIASNLKFLNNLQPEWSRHVTIDHQTKDLHTSDYTQLYNFLKYNQKEVSELRTERLARAHDPLALLANSNNPYNYPMFHQDQPSPVTYMQQPQPNNKYNPQPSFNQNYTQQPMLNPEDITDPTTAMNMEIVLMAKAFKLNYSTPTNNSQKISSNPHHRQIAHSSMNLGQDRQMHMVRGNSRNQFRQYTGQNVKSRNGYNAVQNIRNQIVQNAVQNPGVQNVGNQNGMIVVPVIPNPNVNPNGNGNFVAARAEGNVIGNNDGSAENDSNVISTVFSMEQNGETVEQQPATVEETRAYFESLYNNLAIEVEKVNTHEIFPIVNQVDARVENFEIQFLKEATKFVQDFKSLANEADESLAKHKAWEFEI
ncbi:hypothetical protein Tco_0367146 [Tanacetum coccineum]